MTSKNLNFNNGQLHYTILGDSEQTLVLLHGFIGSLRIWARLSEELSKKYKVICIDLLGHGDSSVFDEIHTMDFMADCVNEILVHEKIDNAVMIGHSMGGYVTLAFAENYPNKLAGFGLFHSHASPDSDDKKKDRDQVIRIVKHRVDIVVSEMLPKLFANEDITPYPLEHKMLSEVANNMTPEAIIAALAGMRDREDKEHVLQFSDVPILYILGEKDPVINFETTKYQFQLNELINPIVLPEVGHMGFIEDYKSTIEAVDSFTRYCFNN